MFGVERANVVEAEDVVGVGMSVQNGVEAGNVFAEGLLPEIWSCVDDDVAGIVGEQNGRAGTPVAWIGGAADIALAG